MNTFEWHRPSMNNFDWHRPSIDLHYDLCQSCDSNMSPMHDLFDHMLRRMLGHIVYMINYTTDALNVIIPNDVWVYHTKDHLEKRRWHYKINEALRPWIYWWISASNKNIHKNISRFLFNTFTMGDVANEHVENLRINLSNDDMYLGKTSDYKRRFREHTASTMRHQELFMYWM